jgi:arginine-tRNA-protein transferase
MGVERSRDQILALLPVSQPFRCPYLPRLARHQALYWNNSDGEFPPRLYQRLMDARFRRSGRLFYRPACDDCSLCIPVRIDVQLYQPSKSQRRVARRNEDIAVHWSIPSLTDEKIELYARYLQGRHPDGPMAQESSAESLWSFLYDSPTKSIEATYRVRDRLVGAGICDVTSTALSTVYFYFDPEESRRSLGTFSSLMEIRHARELGLQHYYLVYLVPGCHKMEYKAALGDHEALIGGEWRPRKRTVPGACI